MKRVVVTGATGFIGFEALPLLLEAGFDVHAVSSKFGSVYPDGVKAHCADLLSPGEQREVLRKIAPTHLLHFAWHVPPGKFWTASENVQWQNASLTLLQEFAAAGGEHWVSAGTCAEYDWSRSGRFRESDPCLPASLYGACKYGFGTIARQIGSLSNVRVAIGRIFYPYGRREAESRLTPSIIQALLAGRPAPCSEGRQVRDFLFVEDVARAFVTVLDSDHEGPVNIGSGCGASVREIVAKIADLIGRPDLVRWGAVPTPVHEPATLVADTDLLESLGFLPRYNLDRGLHETIDWWSRQR